ncbi:MAG: prepilin-type N-terminal cleavage/methylation domain-containing protein [SAR324 cluster bacterium]|nr:prepilin-type N-terminal cleavage/methylation domain-containing protein [SAR324 cluster bacterium]
MSKIHTQIIPDLHTVEDSTQLSAHINPPDSAVPAKNQSPIVTSGRNSKVRKKGFTVLEVLISLSILVLTLMALYQSFSTSIFVLSSTTNLWKAMSHAQNELLKSERATISTPVSLSQGEFELEHQMNGFSWKKHVRDTTPLPGIRVRQVNYQLSWNEGKNVYTYDADIYVNPN